MDTEASEIIDQNDRKKIIRAIEIIQATGKPLKETRGIEETPYNIEWIGKNHDRKTLYARIDKRVDIMLEMGILAQTPDNMIYVPENPSKVNLEDSEIMKRLRSMN